MNNVPLLLGLDYSDGFVQVCAMDQEANVLVNRACRNDWRELVKAVEGKGVVRRVAIEAWMLDAARATSEFETDPQTALRQAVQAATLEPEPAADAVVSGTAQAEASRTVEEPQAPDPTRQVGESSGDGGSE